MLLPDEDMWKAVIECDRGYDGQFFYAVKTVGVYCRPSCKSRSPLQKNVCYFQTGGDAQSSGYRPCKRCRPDLLEYDPAAELARRTKELIDGCYAEKEQLTEEMKRLGVSASHLAVVFKRQYGVAPAEYLNRVRMQPAKKMLAETKRSVIDIAYETGYESLSAFYRAFRKQTGMTPGEYRLRCVRGKNDFADKNGGSI